MLQYQLSIFPFRAGLDEGTDPKQLPPGTLTNLKDYVWLKSGLIQKRFGVQAYGAALFGIRRLMVRGQELLATDGASLFAQTAAGWSQRGGVCPAQITWKTTEDPVSGISSADQVRLNDGSIVYAWIQGDSSSKSSPTGTGIQYRVVDINGFDKVSKTSIAATAPKSIRLVTDGTNFAICFIDVADARVWLSSTGTSSSVGVTTTDAGDGLDAIWTTQIVVAYALGAGGIRLVPMTFAGAVGTAVTTDTATAGVIAVGMTATSDGHIVVGYIKSPTTTVKWFVSLTTTLAVTTTAASISIPGGTTLAGNVGMVPTASDTVVFLWSIIYNPNAETLGLLMGQRVTTAGSATGGTVQAPLLQLISRPWVDPNGLVVAMLSTSMSAAGVPNNLGQDGDDVVLARVNPFVSSGVVQAPLVLAKVDTLIGSHWRTPHTCQPLSINGRMQVLTPFVSGFNASSTRNGFRVVTIGYGGFAAASGDQWRGLELGGETYTIGGVLQTYDGSFTQPISFPFASYVNLSTTAAGTSGSLAAGTYSFSTACERRSAAGVLHRGPVGTPWSVTTSGASGSVSLKFSPIWATATAQVSDGPAHPDELLPIYMIPLTGSTLLRLTVEPTTQYVLNGRASTTHDKSTTIGNPPAVGSPAIYTASGELEDIQPVGMVAGTVYRNRIYAVDGSGLAVWFTKRVDQNPGIAPGWNPANRLLFDKPVTGLAVLDDRLIIFTASGIFIYASDGPELTGDYIGGASLPNKLQTDVGCTNPRSIVSGIDGVYFQCNTDLQMLARNLTVEWVGKPVQDLLSQATETDASGNPIITSAVLVEQQNHIRFTVGGGVTLVYDYVEKNWAQFSYVGGIDIVDAIMHAGAYTFVTGQGQVYKETLGVYLDDGNYVPSQFETAEIASAGPIAYHNVRKVQFDGTSKADHTLTVDVAFNGETSWSQTVVFPSGVANATAPGPIEAVSVSMGTRRKLRTVRYRVTDTAPTVLTTGQGPAWSTMGIEFGVNKGFGRLPARERM